MREERGALAYESGLSAEEAVARDYKARGYLIEGQRVRRASGEIDLIMRDGDQIVFVEVKQSKTHDRAAQALSRRQLHRIYRAASEYLADEKKGQDTPSRVDVALVDGSGRIKCHENVLSD